MQWEMRGFPFPLYETPDDNNDDDHIDDNNTQTLT